MSTPRKIRVAMVGGGEGAFIGDIHRQAMRLTGEIDLVAGAFHRSEEASRRFGLGLGLDAARAYGSHTELLERESALGEHERIDAVAIVTPNDSHADIACAALEAGFHVICDKPLATDLEAGQRIEKAVATSARLFGLTHTYTGYPMVIEARERVAAGELGAIRRVNVSYLQDWLGAQEDATSSAQASWRVDPARSGEAGALADIGTHASNLVEFMTGQRIASVAAQLRAVVPGRVLDDDGGALFELDGGAAGMLSVSQVCSGAVNGLTIEIYGDKASLSWAQELPIRLTLRPRGQPELVLQPGVNMAYLSAAARAACRTPGGHPEGYLEAFANLYAAFAEAVRRYPNVPTTPGFATVEDGVSALKFVRAAVTSSRQNSNWTKL